MLMLNGLKSTALCIFSVTVPTIYFHLFGDVSRIVMNCSNLYLKHKLEYLGKLFPLCITTAISAIGI